MPQENAPLHLVWLVTGCSSGFGHSMVTHLLNRRDKVIATAREPESLAKHELMGAATVQLDVTASQEELNAKAIEAIAKYGRIDIVLNNAGIAQLGTIEDLDQKSMIESFEVNVLGPIKIAKAFLPYFRTQGKGTLLFTGSMMNCNAISGTSFYSASQAAQSRLVEGLAAEVGEAGIRVLEVWPGSFDTNLMDAARLRIPETEHFHQRYKEFRTSVLVYGIGDVEKYCEVLIDLVKGEGVAKGKAFVPLKASNTLELSEKWMHPVPGELPIAIPLGSDALGLLRAKALSIVKLTDDWASIINSTDRDIPEGIAPRRRRAFRISSN